MVTYKETLNEFLGKCKEKFGKDLVSVVLFGSVAKGTAKEYSDIDLLIVAKELPPFEERIPLISDLCYEMLIKYKVSISPILMTPEEFDKNISAGFPLFLGVIMGYKPIFDKNRFSACGTLKRDRAWENTAPPGSGWESGVPTDSRS